MKNKLPEYWCVKCDGSQLFRDTVARYLFDVHKEYCIIKNKVKNCRELILSTVLFE